MTGAELLVALAIFVMRVLNYAIGTLRLVAITNNRKLIAATLAAFEALIFAVVIANIVSDLNNLVNLAAYVLGASAGSWTGMWLESRLITGYVIVNVFAAKAGHEIATALRDAGYGVTEVIGEGRDGTITTLRSVIDRRDTRKLTNLINSRWPDSFIAVEEARTVTRGWMGVGRGGKRS